MTVGFSVFLHSIFWNKEYLEENSLRPYLWEIASSFDYHANMLEFVAGIPYLSVEAPEEYSASKADEIQRESLEKNSTGLMVQTGLQGETPDIIVIMNESFSELRELGYFSTNQEYLPFFHWLQQSSVAGTVTVPIWGGLTSNSEFEFLTGFSNSLFTSGLVPYQTYVKQDTSNLGRQLKDQGYHTIFMHPMDSSGWNRKNVYELFGFDEAYYIDDYEDKGYVRSYVSDASNYAELIRRYETAKEQNENVFLFNVTMQNHGGYTSGALQNPVQITDMSTDYTMAEEYLTLVQESDRAFQQLVTYFSQKEEPVIICMFGDHQPAIEEGFYTELQDRTGDPEVQRLAKQYMTPFVMWSNYEMQEAYYDNISLNYLSTLLLNASGLELSEYQKYLQGLYDSYPVVSMYGTMDSAGNWYDWEAAQDTPEIKEYEIVQYRNLFDYKKKGAE